MPAKCSITINGKPIHSENDAVEVTVDIVVKKLLKSDDPQSTSDNPYDLTM